MKNVKVAIVHDYLVQYGGAEKVVETLTEIFPNAPIYTSIHNPDTMPKSINSKNIITPSTNANKLVSIVPILRKFFTFLIPLAFEGFDLSDYDIVISSSSSYAKGVITRPDQLHISYIHTPPRFLYGYSVESSKRNAWYFKPFVKLIDHFLRNWDYVAAQRANVILANSQHVKERIKKFYNRDATVIYPPVEVNKANKSYEKDNMQKSYYYALGRLSAYKNFDLIIQAFNLLGLNLKIMGTGNEETKLKKLAGNTVEVMGKVDEKTKHQVIQNSLGYIFPVVEEDLGIVVVEALSHGKPVLSHKSGGPTEIIREGTDGMFFENLNLEQFVDKVKQFDKNVRGGKFNVQKMKTRAATFSKEKFMKDFKDFVAKQWEMHNARTS